MSDSSKTVVDSQAPERTLVDTFRKSLAHDVRTPLGAIVNYAAVLESTEDPRASEVHALARKMRDNAMRAAGMLQQVSEAVAVLTSNDRSSEFEIAAMLDHCLQASAAGRAVDVSTGEKLPAVRGHAPLLMFLWQAIFRFDRELRGHAPERVEFEACSERGELDLRVWLKSQVLRRQPTDEAAPAMCVGLERVASDTRLALELALGLVESAGGSCTIQGELGGPCTVALRMPIVV